MGLLYDFTELINRYSVEGQLIRESGQGEYVGGNWIPAPTGEPEIIKGAFLPMAKQKIYQSGGTYTENDREFITLTPIPLEPAAYIIFQGVKYHLEAESDYSLYAGFHSYNLKRVGAFDRAKKINLAIAQGLKTVTGCEVVKANLAGVPIPPYPYISFSITQAETGKGTYSWAGGEERYMPLTQTWSITVQGEDDDETLLKAMQARDWLEETGRLELADQGIVVSRVGAVHNRDTLLTLGYEYRKGFDVVFRLLNVVSDEQREVIEQAEIGRETERK